MDDELTRAGVWICSGSLPGSSLGWRRVAFIQFRLDTTANGFSRSFESFMPDPSYPETRTLCQSLQPYKISHALQAAACFIEETFFQHVHLPRFHVLGPKSTTLFASALVHGADGDQPGTHVGHRVIYNVIYTTIALVGPGLDSNAEACSEVLSLGVEVNKCPTMQSSAKTLGLVARDEWMEYFEVSFGPRLIWNL